MGRYAGEAGSVDLFFEEACLPRFPVAYCLTAHAVAVALVLAGCASSDSGPLGNSGSTQSAAEGTEPADSVWLSTEEMIAWQEEHDAKGTWVVAFFLSPGSECLKSGSGEAIPRFRLFSEEERALNEGQLLREALMALEGPAPEGLANPMEGIRLKLLSSRVEGGTVYLDLASGIDDTNRTGSCGGSAMQAQFIASVRHHFPAARNACVLVEGTRSGQGGEALVFHDKAACPLPLPS